MDTIFDIGFEDGKDTAYYLHKGYNVIAVDADPNLIRLGNIKFANEIKENRLTLLNVGISDSKGSKPFFVNTYKAEWSSFDERLGSRKDPNYYSVNINCITLDELVSQYGTPLYIKIDIEGNDILGIESLLKMPEKKPQYLSIEAAQIDWLDKLVDLGYTKFKLVNQANIKMQSTADWEFYLGSSGQFGENAPGEWLSSSEVKGLYNYLHHPYNYSVDSWYDIHAK